MFHWYVILVTLQAPWGILLEGPPQELADGFRPSGQYERADWTLRTLKTGPLLSYDCLARKGCYAHPSRARFFFTGDRLASAELTFEKERGPDGESIPSVIVRHLGDVGPPVMDTLQAGRRIQYFNRDGVTYVWSQDGPDAQLTLYVDAYDAIGRAEAVSLGAHLNLDAFPGASDYAQGQRAALKEQWTEAIRLFRAALAHKESTPHFKGQTRLVLAMTLAAQVKSEVSSNKISPEMLRSAHQRLDEAIELAPVMKTQLNQLKNEIQSSSTVKKTQK